MFGDNRPMTPMFATEAFGQTAGGDRVTVTKAGDTGRFIVKVGGEWDSLHDYEDPQPDSQSYQTAKQDAVDRAESLAG